MHTNIILIIIIIIIIFYFLKTFAFILAVNSIGCNVFVEL